MSDLIGGGGGGELNLSFLENFVESIALILSRGLTDTETEKVLTSWNSFQARLRRLSAENLRKVKEEAVLVRPYCKHPLGCTQNALRGFIKSFFVCYIVKYGLGFFPALLMGKLFKKPSLLLKIGGSDTISFTLFLSSFTTAFKGTLCLMRRLRGVNDWKNSFAAGVMAGLSLSFDTNKSRRLMIALYLSTRSLHFIGRFFWRHYLEPQWDPHARNREKFVKEKEELDRQTQFGTGNVQRDLGQLRKNSYPPNAQPNALPLVNTKPTQIDLPQRKHSILEFDEEENSGNNNNNSYDFLHRQTKSPILQTSSNFTENKFFPVSNLNKVKIIKLRKFFRQSIAVIVMMLSSSQILYAYICEPDSLAKSYLSFLAVHGGVKDRHGAKSKKFLELLGEVVKAGNNGSSSKFIAMPLAVNSPLPFKEMIPEGMPVERMDDFKDWMCKTPQNFIMCSLEHNETQNCLLGSLKSFNEEWWRAVFLYTPLNTIMSVLFKGNLILKQPKEFSKHLIKSVLRSSLFLTCYCTAAWATPCLLRRICGRDQLWMYYINGAVSGMMVLLEAPGRRLELALYCLPRALESLWNCLVKKGVLRNIRNGELIYFSLSMGVIMTLYQHDPESINDAYRNLMVRFLGIN